MFSYRSLVIFFCIGIIGSWSTAFAGTAEYWGGEILLTNGETYKADKFNISSDTAPLAFRLIDQSKVIRVQWKEIARLEMVEYKGVYLGPSSNIQSYLAEGTVAKLTLRNGNSRDVVLVRVGGNEAVLRESKLNITYIDDFTRQTESSSFFWEDIRVISFGENLGRLKYDEESRIYFPASYNFNPYTGKKLIWKNPGALQVGVVQENLENPETSQTTQDLPYTEIVGEGNLKLIVITPLTAAFSLSRRDLIVTLDGPTTLQETIPNVPTAHPQVVRFNDIPKGTYTVTATYGNKTISKEIEVGGNTLEFEMVMD